MPRQRPAQPSTAGPDEGDRHEADDTAAVPAGTWPPEVMTLPDVAKYLRFSEQHTRRLADDGQLGGWKLGKSWRFARADLDRRLNGG